LLKRANYLIETPSIERNAAHGLQLSPLRQLRCATAIARRTEVSPAASAAATRWTNAARFSTGSNAAVAISWASSSSKSVEPLVA
jgi:hypothetical protein